MPIDLSGRDTPTFDGNMAEFYFEHDGWDFHVAALLLCGIDVQEWKRERELWVLGLADPKLTPEQRASKKLRFTKWWGEIGWDVSVWNELKRAYAAGELAFPAVPRDVLLWTVGRIVLPEVWHPIVARLVAEAGVQVSTVPPLAPPVERPLGERERAALLNTIGGLVAALLGEWDLPSHPSYQKQDSLLRALAERFPNVEGLAYDTLKKRLPDARNSLENAVLESGFPVSAPRVGSKNRKPRSATGPTAGN